MLRVDLARVRLPLIISLLPKKTAPVFLTQLVCIIFLSTFGDIMQTKKQWVWMTISNYNLLVHLVSNVGKRRLKDLSSKIRTTIQPVFVSRKLNEVLKVREVKPAIVNQQCVVYKFQCNLCDAGYVGYTRGHLHERVDGHKLKSSSICKLSEL